MGGDTADETLLSKAEQAPAAAIRTEGLQVRTTLGQVRPLTTIMARLLPASSVGKNSGTHTGAYGPLGSSA